MNEGARISINTPVGKTEPRWTDPNLTQGSTEAAILSSVSISKGTDVTFAQSDCEVQLHGYMLAPFRYMDNILRGGETIASAQHANNLMEDLFERKSLSFNLKKSQFVLIGSKKSRKKLRKELEDTPLKLCNKDMVETDALKYLGDYLLSNLEDSVHVTVLKRVNVVKQTILDIRTVIEDTRAEKLGSMNVAFNIWDQAILGMLTYNAETWVGITKKTLKILDNLFHSFNQKIWRTSTGIPIPHYYWISGNLKFSNYILQKKVLFYFHLANLPPNSLGRIALELQEDHDTPGQTLKKEVEEHIRAIGVTDLQGVSKGILNPIGYGMKHHI